MPYDIMIVGEAWGRDEAVEGRPFVGASGRLLKGLMSQAGLRYDDCYVTNVFNFQPQGKFPDNDLKNICGPKAEGIPGFPSIQSGKYVRAEFEPEVQRLYQEVQNASPQLIIALGASAAWALLGTSGIKKIRGAPHPMGVRALLTIGKAIKVFPTYHPAAVMREWGLRPILIADLVKARGEAEFPELRRPSREIWIEPTIADLATFERDFISSSGDLSIDIETARDQITCVGFAPSVDRAIVIPFVDPVRSDGNYWRTLGEELEAWDYVRRWCGLRRRIVGQNFLYDSHFLWRRYGIPIPHSTDDTMLMHHAMQPELEKGLGFLATIYTEELPWKFMRAKHETIKRED